MMARGSAGETGPARVKAEVGMRMKLLRQMGRRVKVVSQQAGQRRVIGSLHCGWQ